MGLRKMEKKKIVIITGNELRHIFFRKNIALDDNIQVLKSYCESEGDSLKKVVESSDDNSSRMDHIAMRTQTEIDFFKSFCDKVVDLSNPSYIKKNEINSEPIVKELMELNPDLIISYGCSIIREPLLSFFNGRFINIHLGLSPYYRGSGTNFWPFVNNELEYVGVTYMYIDKGIDTGEIIHQIRPRIYPNDNIHQIGNRLIVDMSEVCIKLINQFDNLQKMPQIPFPKESVKYYKKTDFNEQSLATMYENFKNDLISNFLKSSNQLTSQVSIINNPGIEL